MRRFWTSFYFKGPHGAESDYRPLNWPPHPGILGYWHTGIRCEDESLTLVVWVEAENEGHAMDLISVDWPESVGAEWRFFDEVALDWRPSDRFPISDWNVERIEGKVA